MSFPSSLLALLLAVAPSWAQEAAECRLSRDSLRASDPHLNCSCPHGDRSNTIPDCTDGNAPSAASASGRHKSGGMSFNQKVGVMATQMLFEALIKSMLAPPEPPPSAPAPPPPPQYVANPAYEAALRKLKSLQGPGSEMRAVLVAELSDVPQANLPPRTPDPLKQLLASACLGQAAARTQDDKESEVLLRQSAQAMAGQMFSVSMSGCDIPEPPMPAPPAIDKRRKAAELAADLFARAGELDLKAGQSRERVTRAEAAVAQAEKAAEGADETGGMGQAARDAAEAARKELVEAKAEAERLEREAKEAAEKGRSIADRLDQAGGDGKKLDDLFQEFDVGR
ncbi:MAG: hypothetical protein ABII00_06100 [Elusimicrobiota bacterium]